jgi:hypothetical protein
VPHLTDKLFGKEPVAFKGDRTQAEDFLTQWALYCGANRNNMALQNQYQKCMMFLTFIQGPLVQPWVLAVSRWLITRITTNHISEFNPILWTDIEDAFRQQFADTMKQEKAQATLRQGIFMKEGNIDEYVAQFDTLVHEAGFDPDDLQTLEKFTRGLPIGLYENIYQFNLPTDYEGWRRAALNQQQKWIHMQSLRKARKNLSQFEPTPRRGNNAGPA